MVVCESPHTIEYEDGSNAVGLAADIVYDELINNFEDWYDGEE
jgi:hypothetical protein